MESEIRAVKSVAQNLDIKMKKAVDSLERIESNTGWISLEETNSLLAKILERLECVEKTIKNKV